MGGRSSAELAARETKGPSTRLEPFNFEEPSFDPNYGFPNGRKPRGNLYFQIYHFEISQFPSTIIIRTLSVRSCKIDMFTII